jgi:hypothetical protein
VVTGVVVLNIMTTLLLTAQPASAAAPSTSAAAPTSRITFGVAPAASIGPDGRANFTFSATPGAIAFDHVAALNYSSTPLSLQIYATDALETANGGFGLLPATTKATGVGAWISGLPGGAVVTVPPENGNHPGLVIIPFSVHVPATVTPGDHVGGIVASLQTTGTNSTGQKIVLDQRVGSRVYIRVAGQLQPSLTLTHQQASYSGTLNPVGTGTVQVKYVVTNTGNVDLALSRQTVSVSGFIGPNSRVSLPRVTLLLPGASVAESAAIPGVWPTVVTQAHVTVQPEEVTSSDSNSQPLAPVTSDSTVWAVPWSLLILIVLVVAAIVLLLRRRRRRAKHQQAGTVEVAAPARTKVASAP